MKTGKSRGVTDEAVPALAGLKPLPPAPQETRPHAKPGTVPEWECKRSRTGLRIVAQINAHRRPEAGLSPAAMPSHGPRGPAFEPPAAAWIAVQ